MARLKAEGARLAVGYEANGGFLLGGTAVSPDGRRLTALPTRDAMLPALAVLAAMAREGRALSDLVGDLPARATESGRLQDVDPGAASRFLDGLAASDAARGALLSRLGAGGLVATDTLDGVRMTLASGEIVHLRLSGNAPELRCYTEAATPERAAELLARHPRRSGAGAPASHAAELGVGPADGAGDRAGAVGFDHQLHLEEGWGSRSAPWCLPGPPRARRPGRGRRRRCRR